MPYSVRKRGNKWCVIKDTDNSTVACHDSKTQAERQVRALYTNETKSFVFKSNERRYMFLISSNAYRDREGDIVKEKALREYVANFKPTPHLYWHGGDPIGEIIGAKMVGPFLLELSQELPDEEIDLKRFEDESPMLVQRKAVWDVLENGAIAWGSSIGFAHQQGDEQDHEFERVLKVETSSLPLTKAANGITPSFVIGGKPMSETTKQDRRNLFEKLLGKGPVNELEAAIEGMKTALDKSGLERKEFDSMKVKGLVEEMQARIMEILGELTDDEAKKTALANTIAAELMGTATEVVDETMPMEEMQDGQNPEDEQMPQVMMELGEQVKALAQESTDVQNEMKELIPAVVDIAHAFTVKEQEVEALEARLLKIEKLMALTPRPASTAKETAVENATVKNEIDKSLRGQKTVLGIPVKE
jgi:hypothetical protein